MLVVREKKNYLETGGFEPTTFEFWWWVKYLISFNICAGVEQASSESISCLLPEMAVALSKILR